MNRQGWMMPDCEEIKVLPAEIIVPHVTSWIDT